MNLLAGNLYDPAVAVDKATTAVIAMTALDTVNLRLAITVPAHGMVRFRLAGILHGATTTPQILLGVMNGATVIGRCAPMTGGSAGAATSLVKAEVDFIVTGLAPGAMNVDAAYGVETVVAATGLKYGGPDNTVANDAFGGFVFEAWNAQPQTATAAAVWDRVLTGATHNIAASAGRRLRTLDITIDSGTAAAGSADSITLGASASATVGLYVGCKIYIDSGTGAGQSRYIVGYTAAKVAWVARSWTVAPDATSTYVVAADNQVPFIHLGLAQAGAASTITLDAGASATNDIYNGQGIRITAGTGDNQIRVVTAYNGTTKVATVAPPWTTVPDVTSYFATLQTGTVDVASVNRTAVIGKGTAADLWRA